MKKMFLFIMLFCFACNQEKVITYTDCKMNSENEDKVLTAFNTCMANASRDASLYTISSYEREKIRGVCQQTILQLYCHSTLSETK